MTTCDPHLGSGIRARSFWRPSPAHPASGVPGACGVVLVRARDLTDAHVIRLGRGQGTWPIPARRSCRPGGEAIEVRHAWREVLDVFCDRDSLEAQFGQRQPACAQQGCSARLQDDGWHIHSAASTADGHEHKPRHRPGQLDAGLAGLADKVWEDSAGSILVRVLIHELSDPGEIEDLFVVLNRNDLIESQSLPAAGRETAWARGPGRRVHPGHAGQADHGCRGAVGQHRRARPARRAVGASARRAGPGSRRAPGQPGPGDRLQRARYPPPAGARPPPGHLRPHDRFLPGSRSDLMKIRKPNRVTTPRRAVLNGTRVGHASMPRARGRWLPGPRWDRASAPGPAQGARPPEDARPQMGTSRGEKR